jgi:hypothetical protein
MRSLPFTAEVLFSLFETYNRAIWPAQLIAYGLGMAVLALALRPLAAGGAHRAGRSGGPVALERHSLSPHAFRADQFCSARLRRVVRAPGCALRRKRAYA